MRILLTGAKGNLGSSIVKHNSSHDIVCFDRDDWVDLPRILASRIDVVVHLAYDLVNKLEDFPVKIVDSNVAATARLVEIMKEQGIPRLLFISSCAVYGNCMNTNEEMATNPVTVNGIVKLLNERIVEKFCRSNNIHFEIYRVFNMYGGNDNFSVISKLLKAAKNGGEFVLNNNGISQRDFIHVEDVARLILKLLENKSNHSCLNIGTGISTRIEQIVSCVAEKNPRLKIKHVCLPEAEYSRADIGRLLSIVKYDFMKVMDFIKTQL